MSGLMRVARFLGWREFVVAFFIMASAATLPNLFVGISSALRGFPQLSFGDVAGNNLAALTLSAAIAAMFCKKNIPAKSKTIQMTAVIAFAAVLLPLLLTLDGNLSRIDGAVLILTFLLYVIWLFSKQERFTKVYKGTKSVSEFKKFVFDIVKLVAGILLLIIAAQGIVVSANQFAASLGLSLILIGVLITGPGSALPEIYFDVQSAKKNEPWMILGDSMGAVILPATLVLGVVSLISPIYIIDFSSFAIARIFLVISAIAFLYFVKTKQAFTKKEAFFMIGLYVLFLITEIFLKGYIERSWFNFLMH